MSEERPPHAPYVFLSYARADRTKARAIVSALEAQGLRIWWDGLVEGGHEFADKIEEALNSADVVVVLWSPASVHSHWVRDEAAAGQVLHASIVSGSAAQVNACAARNSSFHA